MQADYRELEKKFEAAGQPIISILEDMHDGFLVIDHNSTIIYLNKALTKSLQIERSTVLGRKVWDVLPNVFGRKLHHQLQQAVMKKMSICFESFCEPIHKYFEWTIHPSHELISIYCKDISERKHKEEMIDTLIYYDMLTGLPNFKLFQDRLNQVIVFSKHYHESVAVLMIHLDRMKHFTDIEDFLLKEIANKLIELFAERGTVSRMSNNKFICFYQYTERTKLLDLLEKVISYLSNPILINGENCLLTPSVGISMYPLMGGFSNITISC
ncbi:GGDEF domain-containing protein [Bacillus sp. JCM 19034]|uniref:diguanylate cyclase domain-containing protein n=1 Tax=Bacillus sp. JCM 19034 TaxID=1481928 RepID=UPI0007810C30|nr:GGDEF domain-containing protein [Bacillus sp. JCM 19034]